MGSLHVTRHTATTGSNTHHSMEAYIDFDLSTLSSERDTSSRGL